MRSTMGPHIQHVTEGQYMAEWINGVKPKVVKTMEDDVDFIKACEAANPLWIIRRYTEDQDVSDPSEGAHEHYERIMRSATVQYMLRTGIPFVAEGFNEVNTGYGQQFNDLCSYDRVLANLLRPRGIQYVGGSVGVGHPPLHFKDYWPVDYNDPKWTDQDRARMVPLYQYEPFLEALAACAFYGIHEYFAPSMWDERNLDPAEPGTGWWLFRYRKWWTKLPAQYKKPLLITETGIDSGAPHFWPGAQGGWQSFGPADMNEKIMWFMEQLLWYDLELLKDGVYGATPFLWGTRDKKHWPSFDLLEPREASEAFAALILSQQEEEEPEVPNGWVDLRTALPRHANYPYGRHLNDDYLYKQRQLADVDTVVIHHTGYRIVGPEAVARYHVNDRGWAAISYHIFIPPDGTIYWTHDFDRVTSHAQDYNPRSVGLCLEGNFTGGSEPTTRQMESARMALSQLTEIVNHSKVVGHQEVVSTQCPGDTWDIWKRQLTDGTPPDDWEAKYLESQAEVGRLSGLLVDIEETAKER